MKWKNMNNWRVWMMMVVCWTAAVMAHADSYDYAAEELDENPHAVSCHKPFDPVEFKKRLEGYIIKEAGLTPSETLHFFPKFHELRDNQRKLHGRIGRLVFVIRKKHLTETECNDILDEIVKLKKQNAEMQVAAIKSWRKILPASKILKVMNAEHRFGRHTFRDMVKVKGASATSVKPSRCDEASPATRLK